MSQKAVNYKSCFDVIGPIMIGPSSSHTAGAVQMGVIARQLLGTTAKQVICKYYESFAQTHKGHGTDYAIISGVLGFATNDSRVPNAIEIAMEQQIAIQFIEEQIDSPIQHANTADITLIADNKQINIVAASIGGGTVEVRHIAINDMAIDLTGPLPVLVVLSDNYEVIRQVKQFLEREKIHVLNMRMKDEQHQVLCALELNDILSQRVKDDLYQLNTLADIYILDQH